MSKTALPIRRLRKKLDKDKQNQKVNLLWCAFGLVVLPCLGWLYVAIQKLPISILAGAEIALLLLLMTLSTAYFLLKDRFNVAYKFLEDQNTTWDEVEQRVEYLDAWNEAEEHENKNP